jgi:hypothetical protein
MTPKMPAIIPPIGPAMAVPIITPELKPITSLVLSSLLRCSAIALPDNKQVSAIIVVILVFVDLICFIVFSKKVVV